MACAAVLLCALAGPVRAQTPVDLQLVLAVDTSGSIDPDELRVQRQGYAAGLTDPMVIDAIRRGALGRIAVTYFEWAGPDSQTVIVPWQIVDGSGSAAAVAETLLSAPVGPLQGTSISAALLFAAGLFADSGFAADRRVVDISGDGPNNTGPPMLAARDAVLARGIVVNGLPLMTSPAWYGPGLALDDYYRDCVIGGDDAFVLPVRDAGMIGTAIRRKLLLEVATSGARPKRVAVADLAPARAWRVAEAAADCSFGERMRSDK